MEKIELRQIDLELLPTGYNPENGLPSNNLRYCNKEEGKPAFLIYYDDSNKAYIAKYNGAAHVIGDILTQQSAIEAFAALHYRPAVNYMGLQINA